MFSVASWNVNSVNARLESVDRFIKETRVFVMCLQELKCTHEKFPIMVDCFEPYNVQMHGQKSYNGVSIISKNVQDDIQIGIPGFEHQHLTGEARYIESMISYGSVPIRLISVYVPNGSEVYSEKFYFKLEFLGALRKRLAYLLDNGENIIVCGDMNVALDPLDVYDANHMEGSLCFHIDERKAFRSILNLGLHDAFRVINPNAKKFSWWDYRKGGFEHDKGLRIDYILISSYLCDLLVSCDIYTAARGWNKPSDHAPLICKFNI